MHGDVCINTTVGMCQSQTQPFLQYEEHNILEHLHTYAACPTYLIRSRISQQLNLWLGFNFTCTFRCCSSVTSRKSLTLELHISACNAACYSNKIVLYPGFVTQFLYAQ